VSTILEERVALANQLSVKLADLNVYAYWPNNIQFPALLIKPSVRREEAFVGGLVRRYSLELLSIASDNEESQTEVDLYLEESGPYSIQEALMDDPTLGGVVDNTIYVGWFDYGGRRSETLTYIGATIEVEVWVTHG
jgi:hypothetical protein